MHDATHVFRLLLTRGADVTFGKVFAAMPDELIELARFPTSEEASIVRGQLESEGIRTELSGEAVAGWLWHFGTAVGGVRLLISAADADRAQVILGAVSAIDETEDFGDRSFEDVDVDEQELPDDMVRAWRASLIGLFLLPPLLNLFSTWLLVRNQFFIDHRRNWRVMAASFTNLFVFAVVAWFVWMIAVQQPEPQHLGPNGQPLSLEKTTSIPLVPY